MAPPVAGYIDWWDATDTATMSLTGSRVDTWTSKGSLATVLTLYVGTGALTGTRTINTRNVVDFDGASGFRNTSYVKSQPMTYFFVIQADSGNTGHLMDGVVDPNRNLVGYNSNQYAIYAGTAAGNLGYGTMDTATHIRAVTFNTTSSTEHLDGVSVFAGDVGTQTLTELYFGGAAFTAYFDGAIGEAIFYASALNSTDRQSVESYLTARWVTAPTPPPTPRGMRG